MCHFALEWLPRLTSGKNTPKYSSAFSRTVLAQIANVALPRVLARFRVYGVRAHILAHTFPRRFLINARVRTHAANVHLMATLLEMTVFLGFP